MRPSHDEVRALVSALSRKLSSAATLSFLSQEVAMSLSGLQSMSSEHREVLELISTLTPAIQSCLEPLSAQGVAMCMQGFRLCQSEHEEVRNLIIAVTACFLRSPDVVLTAQGVVMCIYSLRYLNSDHAEVRDLLSALTPKIQRSREALDPIDFLNCMRGLKAMNCDWGEVRDLLRALRGKIPPSQGEMWWYEILRSDVFGTDELVEDLRHYSSLKSHFRQMLEYVLGDDEAGMVANIMSQRLRDIQQR